MFNSDANNAFTAAMQQALTANTDVSTTYGLVTSTNGEPQGSQAIALPLQSHRSSGAIEHDFEISLFNSSTPGSFANVSDTFQTGDSARSNETQSLERIIQKSYDALASFSTSESLAEDMLLAFGENYDVASTAQFLYALHQDGASALPKIELVAGDALNQAYGVYAQSTDTVYFSREFLADGTESEQIKVLLEEIGHSLDARINSQDAAGDEGELFSRLVLGEAISALELAQLKTEDDSATLKINGQILEVEMNGTLPTVGVTSGSSISEATLNGEIYQTVRGTDSLIYSRSSSDRVTWTNWQEFGGATLDNPELAVFNNRLYQSVRGTDNLIYLRSSTDGQSWTAWQQLGSTTQESPELVVFNDRLYQSVRGTDNLIYMRSSADGQNWTALQQFGGAAPGNPSLAVFNNRLYQSVRGTDNLIYMRSSADGQNWALWQEIGGTTADKPSLEVFNNQLHQTIRGIDNRLYLRRSSDGTNWTDWQGFDGVTLLGSPKLTNANGYLTASALGNDNQLHYRYSSDGETWTNWDAAPPADPASLTDPAPPTNPVSQPQDSDSSFNIEFDYRFDTDGWFTPERRAALEASAEVWESIILDDFETTEVGTATPFVTNPQTGSYAGSNSIFITDVEIDDLLIFVGARALGSGTLGQGGASGYYLNEERYIGSDFEPWLGSISFNRNADWFFDSTPSTSNDIPSSQSDFISTAVHEIGHILGFNSSIEAFAEHLNSAGDFAGPNAMARNGGAAIPLEGSHIEDGYEFGGSGEAVLDPISFSGVRQLPTVLDIAIFDDIGYEVDYSKAAQNESENRDSGISGDTGSNRMVAHDSLAPDCCSCDNCQSNSLQLALTGETSLEEMVMG